MKILYYSGLFWMAIMLFILHSAFAYSIIPIFLALDFFRELFLLPNGLDLKLFFPYVFGATFAFAISAIMALLDKHDVKFWKFAKTVALLELIGIVLIVYPEHGNIWTIISGLYYGAYLYFAVIFYFYIKPDAKIENAKENANVQKTANAKNKNVANVMQMRKENKEPQEIAELLNINLSTVYRIIKKHDNDKENS